MTREQLELMRAAHLELEAAMAHMGIRFTPLAELERNRDEAVKRAAARRNQEAK